MPAKEPKNPEKKVYWRKKPGFEAFADRSQPLPSERKNRHGKQLASVEVKELVVPVTGIHSLKWAQAIAPQISFLFNKLPFELRSRIFEFVIGGFEGQGNAISPVDYRKVFRSAGWRTAARYTENLYHICRQAYVDIYGSGLLYKFKPFAFDSPKLMMNYLTVINPLHKDTIHSFEITFYLSDTQPLLGPALALSTISSMAGLRAFHIHIFVYHSLCDPHPAGGTGHVKQSVVDGIRECKLWGMIKGLQSFQIHFDLPDSDSENPHYGPYRDDEDEEALRLEDDSLRRWDQLEIDVVTILKEANPLLEIPEMPVTVERGSLGAE